MSQQETMTTREAAELLGVGTTSIKRWADAGLLPCVKTPGGHRRFLREVITSFIDNEEKPSAAEVSDRVASWVSSLSALTPRRRAFDILRVERRQLGSWFLVADGMSEVLDEIGRRWTRGELSVVQEHIATERLSRALSRCCELIELPKNAKRVLLTLAEGEAHVMGLRLAELCFREAGWAATLTEKDMPLEAVASEVAQGKTDLLAVSASSNSRDAEALAKRAEKLGEVCKAKGIPLILGGQGLWPERLSYGYRIRSFTDLRNVLQMIGQPAGESAESQEASITDISEGSARRQKESYGYRQDIASAS